jgi:DNA polymerase (family 10)
VTKSEVADILDEMGTLMELIGENPFKSRAFHNASRIIGALTADLEELVASEQLSTIKGIGQGLAQKITDLVRTGKTKEHEELRRKVPAGLLEMLKIQGLGPKKITLLHKKLKISSVAELRKAAEGHRLEKLEGFGKKTEENILSGIAQLSRHADKHLYSEAREAAQRMYETVRKAKGVARCEIAGSLRRRREVIGDIDILVSSTAAAAPGIMKSFTSHADVGAVLAHGETKSSVRLKSGINCDLRIVSDAEYPFALAYFTGNKDHNVAMRSLAKKFGWSLNEYGFSKLGSEEKRGNAKAVVKCRDEAEIFKAVGLAYIPPELRENLGEFESAESNKLPRLVDDNDLRGTFHTHTTYSDGANTLTEMAEAARALGWEYLGIADHSKIAAYAGGLSEARVKEQHKEIDALNAHFKNFRIFKGTECDILPDGSLDWGDGVLSRFDYVVASIHSKFKMTEAEGTKRIIKALKNKYVTMLGHPTGRLLLQREGYPVNMTDVIKAACDYGKMIEINSHPLRLDLDWRLCRYAKDRGVMISINPDAHKTDGLKDVMYGVGIARKGWLEKNDILNTHTLSEVDKILNR